jgi:hypothetical protein
MSKFRGKKGKWNNGTLEYWVYEKISLVFWHYSIIPAFHYSRISS